MKRTISIDARMIHSTGIGTYLRNLLENIATIDNEFQFQILCSEGEPLPELPAGQFEFRIAQGSIYSLREQWVIPRLAAKTDLLHYTVRTFANTRPLFTECPTEFPPDEAIAQPVAASGVAADAVPAAT